MSLVGLVKWALKGSFIKEYYEDTSEINILTTDTPQDHKHELGCAPGKSRGTFIFNFGENPVTINRPNGKTFDVAPGTAATFQFEGWDRFQCVSTNAGEHTNLYVVSWL